MNIAIPISRFDSSGGIRVLTVLANGLAERGYNTTFIVPAGRDRPFFPLHSRVEVAIIRPNFGDTAVGGLLKKGQLAIAGPKSVDIAIANAFMTAYSVRFNRVIGRARRGLYFVQHYEPIAFGEYAQAPGWMKLLKKKFAERSYHLGLECITNSKWTAQMLLDKHGVASAVAPLGVDTKIFTPETADKNKKPGELVLVIIGNANPIKRFDLSVEVARTLHRSAGCKTIIASTNPSQFDIKGFPVEFISPANDFDMAAIYRAGSVFLSTSITEGFGLPLLEAMACGTPVVTTDSGGIRDFCKDGYNCRIVPSASADDLANVILELHAKPHVADHLVRNGLSTARKWQWGGLVDAFERVIQEPPRRNRL